MSESSNRLKILSYNIHKGFGLTRKAFTLHGIREAIIELEPDIVFLQEVLGEHVKHAKAIPDWPSDSQFEFLAKDIWSHNVYGQNSVYAHGHHGNAILSKLPISSWSNLNITTNLFESRGLLHAVIDVPGVFSGRLHCMCVHLNLLKGGRTVQLTQIVRKIISDIPKDEALIIAILCEETGVSESFRTLYGNYARTYPARFPLLKVDRVYARGLKVGDAQVMSGRPWSRLSDHAALFVELAL